MNLLSSIVNFAGHYPTREKSHASRTYSSHAEQIYQGRWFDVASAAAGAGVHALMQYACGTVTVSLYRGTVSFAAAEAAPASLYRADTASMEAIGDFNHDDSEGYVRATGHGIKAA